MNLLPHKDPLNAQQKEAVRLREDERLTYREIAARMGVTDHRIRQVLAAVKVLRQGCEAHGEEALCLVPKRIRDFLVRNDLTSPAALRAVIQSKRLVWDDSRKRLMWNEKSPRNLGWKSWQVMCEWAGLPRPECSIDTMEG